MKTNLCFAAVAIFGIISCSKESLSVATLRKEKAKESKVRGTIAVLRSEPDLDSLFDSGDSVKALIAFEIRSFDARTNIYRLSLQCQTKKKDETQGPILDSLKKSADTLEISFKISDLKSPENPVKCEFTITEGNKFIHYSRPIAISKKIRIKLRT